METAIAFISFVIVSFYLFALIKQQKRELIRYIKDESYQRRRSIDSLSKHVNKVIKDTEKLTKRN